MVRIFFILLVLSFSACTHISVSDLKYFDSVQKQEQSLNNDMKLFPANLVVDMECTYSSYLKSCSNKSRLKLILTELESRGHQLKLDKSEDATLISFQEKHPLAYAGGLFELGNILTLGIFPKYYATKYIASYKDPKTKTYFSKEVKVSTSTSWLSLLKKKQTDLTFDKAKNVAELNLIKEIISFTAKE